MDQGVVRVRQGRGVKLRPMVKRSTMWRRARRRLQHSRIRSKVRRQKSVLNQGPVHSSGKTGQSDFPK
jgi:hypothetical protein